MIDRKNENNETLNSYPESTFIRYLEGLMSYTFKRPRFMKNLFYVTGAASATCVAAPWALSIAGAEVSAAVLAATTVVGVVGVGYSFLNSFAQHRIFGFPVTKEEAAKAYQQVKCEHNSAKGKIILKPGHMPLLEIKSATHYDAGYVEGYLLGAAMKDIMGHIDFFYPLIRTYAFVKAKLSGAANHWDLAERLDEVLEHIPLKYQQEMQGKVDGYNAWLKINFPADEQLTFERYVLMQLLPDLRNYHQFLVPTPTQMACTSIALRLGDYTFFIRVLDWPSHGVAGKYFIQLDRDIEGTNRTVDFANPLVSGALTVLNMSGTLFQMNIAPGNNVKKAQGMPAVFFNRYCAEHAKSVDDIQAVMQEYQPLGAYHLTASDGVTTKSFHFYLSETTPNAHEVESLPANGDIASILLVANHGLRYEEGKKKELVNHRDSNQRMQNILQFISRDRVQDKFAENIQRQQGQRKLGKNDIQELEQLCVEIARVALVNNCESVLCALYVYYQDILIDARAATNNLYAQEQELDEFKELSIPLFMKL
jgi:hypothetical protein